MIKLWFESKSTDRIWRSHVKLIVASSCWLRRNRKSEIHFQSTWKCTVRRIRLANDAFTQCKHTKCVYTLRTVCNYSTQLKSKLNFSKMTSECKQIRKIAEHTQIQLGLYCHHCVVLSTYHTVLYTTVLFAELAAVWKKIYASVFLFAFLLFSCSACFAGPKAKQCTRSALFLAAYTQDATRVGLLLSARNREKKKRSEQRNDLERTTDKENRAGETRTAH